MSGFTLQCNGVNHEDSTEDTLDCCRLYATKELPQDIHGRVL